MKLNKITFFISLIIFYSSSASATLSYRCEHQASQNAVQIPIGDYFYVQINSPSKFNEYEVASFKNNQLVKVLSYKNGVVEYSNFIENSLRKENWNSFRKELNEFKSEIESLLSYDDKKRVLSHELYLDFLTELNNPQIYHSVSWDNSTEAIKKKQVDASFSFKRPEIEVEKITTLPGHKINYQIANKNITFNDETGMLLMVEDKVNSAFLRYLFVCKTWEKNKLNFSKKAINLKLSQDYKSKVTLTFDLIFKAIANGQKEKNNISGLTNEEKIKIVNALLKSNVLAGSFEIKKSSEQVLDFIYKYSKEQNPETLLRIEKEYLKKIYSDMFDVIIMFQKMKSKGN